VAQLLDDDHRQEPGGAADPRRSDAVAPGDALVATAATKWFIWEDDLGSIEVGNHADLAVLDRDYFTVPDDESSACGRS
jgi:predicted amidohydrolase YtcJ